MDNIKYSKYLNIIILFVIIVAVFFAIYPNMLEYKIKFNNKKEELVIDNKIKEEIENVQFNAININTASIEELDELPGVGERTAQNIIIEREIALFSYIEDIMYAKGIGPSKFESIKYLIKTK